MAFIMMLIYGAVGLLGLKFLLRAVRMLFGAGDHLLDKIEDKFRR